jgi:hypothetical protein
MRHFLIVLLTSVLFAGPAWAEVAVERVPPFDKGISLPGCDKVWDTVAKYTARGANFLGKRIADNAMGWYDLVAHGDPSRMVSSLDNAWNDVKGGAKFTAKNWIYVSPLAVGILVGEVIPGGKVKNFMNKGRGVLQDKMGDLSDATLDAAGNTISEIGKDGWSMLSRLDDPSAFAKQFAKLNQKWNPALTWSYMLTEDDPLKGMLKTVKAWKHQYDTAKALSGGGAFAKAAVVDGLTKVALDSAERDIIPLFSDPEEQRAIRAMVLAVLSEVLAERTGDPDSHPFYTTTHLEKAPAALVWNDRKSGGRYSWAIWRPDIVNKTFASCITLGDYMLGSHSPAPELPVICNAMAGLNDWWKRPEDYKIVYSDRCSGASKSGSIWAPVCPEGYVGVGFVAHTKASTKPLPNRIACLKNDPAIFRLDNGVLALGAAPWVNDSKSGAKFNTTVFSRKFAGQDLMYAVPGLKPDLSAQQVPVSWKALGGPKVTPGVVPGEIPTGPPMLMATRKSGPQPVTQIKHDGKCWTEGKKATLVYASCKSKKKAQKFTLAAGPNAGWYQVRSLSGKCLTPKMQAGASGTETILFDCSGDVSQQWRPLYVGKGQVVLQNEKAGRCLSGEDKKLYLRNCMPYAGDAQSFGMLNSALKFSEQAATHFPEPKVQFKNGKKCLGEGAKGPAVAAVSCKNRAPAQYFALPTQKWSEIRSYSGKCLTTRMYGKAAGTSVILFDCAGKTAQQWRALSLGDKKVVLQHKASMRCLAGEKKRFVLRDCSPYKASAQVLRVIAGELGAREQAAQYFKDPKGIYLK